MTALITMVGYNKLVDKLHQLRYEEQPIITKMIEESRPTGCVEDNPEYIYAMNLMASLNKKITDIEIALSNCQLFTKEMINPEVVGFSSTVKLLNLNTNKEITYTILSTYESDLDKGIISIDSPLAKELLGNYIGDCVEVNDTDYEILNICYASQE